MKSTTPPSTILKLALSIQTEPEAWILLPFVLVARETAVYESNIQALSEHKGARRWNALHTDSLLMLCRFSCGSIEQGIKAVGFSCSVPLKSLEEKTREAMEVVSEYDRFTNFSKWYKVMKNLVLELQALENGKVLQAKKVNPTRHS